MFSYLKKSLIMISTTCIHKVKSVKMSTIIWILLKKKFFMKIISDNFGILFLFCFDLGMLTYLVLHFFDNVCLYTLIGKYFIWAA